MPTGLRSQTPISQTASKPNSARASHSEEGIEPNSTKVPYFSLSSESQTHVLISNTVGFKAQLFVCIDDAPPHLTSYLPIFSPIASPETISSTRRFFWRPAAVSLSATGMVLPPPIAVIDSPSRPWRIR